jgi:predicted HTH domain antitoxin
VHISDVTTIPIAVDEDLASLLRVGERPLPDAVIELMALELFRRGVVSSGKAAEWLGTSRHEFISHASRLGIPILQMSADEWKSEAEVAARL